MRTRVQPIAADEQGQQPAIVGANPDPDRDPALPQGTVGGIEVDITMKTSDGGRAAEPRWQDGVPQYCERLGSSHVTAKL